MKRTRSKRMMKRMPRRAMTIVRHNKLMMRVMVLM